MAQLLNTQIDGGLGFGPVSSASNKLITIQNIGLYDSKTNYTRAFPLQASSSMPDTSKIYSKVSFDVDYFIQNGGTAKIAFSYAFSRTSSGSWRTDVTSMSMDNPAILSNDINDPTLLASASLAINSSNTAGTVRIYGALGHNGLNIYGYVSGGVTGVTYYLDEVFLILTGPIRMSNPYNEVVMGKDILVFNQSPSTLNTNNIYISSSEISGGVASKGSKNIVIGSLANIENLKKSNSVFIGNNVGMLYSNPASSSCTFINGNHSTEYKILIGSGDGTNNMGVASGGSWVFASDRRDKTDIEGIDTKKALEFVNKLNPKTYVMNYRASYINDGDIKTFDVKEYKKGSKKHTRRMSGFIAQEVYQTLKDTYNTDNYAAIVDYNNYEGQLNPDEQFDQYVIRTDCIIPFLVAAIQEQDKKIKELEEIIKKQQKNTD